MKSFTLKTIVSCLLTWGLICNLVYAQSPSATLNPGTSNIISGQSVNFTVTTSGFGNNNNNRTYVYNITGPVNTTQTFTCTSNCNTQTHSITFNTAGAYTVSVTVTQTESGSATVTSGNVNVNVFNPNLWAVNANSSNSSVLQFSTVNGTFNAGPHNLFNLSMGQPTAALAMSLPQAPPSGSGPAIPYFYWLQNVSNNGTVNVYGATITGSNQTFIGSLDLNGSSNNNLGFVRLGMGPDGICYILAGDGSTVYLASFKPNGVTPNSSLPVNDRLALIDANGITLTGGAANEFQNGDLAVLNDNVGGGVKIYALANVTNGVTKIFVGKPNGNSTTFNHKWNLVTSNGSPFTTSVNGVAFDNAGSMYISTGGGIYFVDANTVNSVASGTVVTSLVWAGSGLTDLATNFFPSGGSPLPVTLVSFNGSLKNNVVTLQWRSQHEVDFDHYIVERSENNSNFLKVGKVVAKGTHNGEASYQFTDDLSGINGKTLFYRLKMVDTDGKFRYSNVIVLRKDDHNIKGISLAPNPVLSGQATLRLDAITNTVIQIRIMDLTGKVMSQQNTRVSAGANSITLNNISQLQPGNYLLQVIQDGAMTTLKFTVAK